MTFIGRTSKLRELAMVYSNYLTKSWFAFLMWYCSACKGKEWKGVLKEWLNLLRAMRNLRSFNQSQQLKEVLQNRLVQWFDDAFIYFMLIYSFCISYFHLKSQLECTKFFFTLLESLGRFC